MTTPPLHLVLPELPAEYREQEAAVLARSRADHWADRLTAADPTLFSFDPTTVAAIERRTGWLRLPLTMRATARELQRLAAELHAEGLRDVVLMGMGGSSLAPEVIAATVGVAPAGMRLRVIDSTEPSAVRAAFADLNPTTTLLVAASKSGATTETLALLAFARTWASSALSDEAIDARTLLIADPGAPMAALSGGRTVRAALVHPADVGGRYSALTPVGLLPTALLGHDPMILLDGGAVVDGQINDDAPAVAMGVRLGAVAQAGADRLTLIADPSLRATGVWIEQLIAESTGKEGKGIIPIDREPIGAAAVYGSGRTILRLRDAHAPDPSLDALAATIGEHGLPRIEMTVTPDLAGIGALFVACEVATAIAAAVIGINPFDEPNVAESKANTGALLDGVIAGRPVPTAPVAARFERLHLSGDAHAPHPHVENEAVEYVRAFLARVPTDGYIAICAYLHGTPAIDERLNALRAVLRDRRIVTTAGYGPRFLHSTGQLHKGGPRRGAFLLLRADREPLPIPGRPYGFETLIEAQARGDARALDERGRPILEVALGADVDTALATLRRLIEQAID
jgi:transaldolase/glucose-6-phosphate isomerase